tara:strand:+ start:191 stop:2413 length:2223 start_codon:yes stop_codon:yes gene_type:complete
MKKLIFLLIFVTNFSFSQTCGYLPDLFISEVTDASLGGVSYVEIYNGTENTINLSGYNLKTYNNGSVLVNTTINLLPYSLLPQSTYIVALGVVSSPTTSNTCLSVNGGNGSLSNQTSGGGSINFTVGGSDCIRLCNGATVIDTFGTFGSATWSNSLGIGLKGVDFRRKNFATVPSVNYINSDWDIIDWLDTPTCSNDNYLDIGVYTFIIPTSTTWDGTSWSNGNPSLTKLTIIDGDYNTTPNGSFDACSLIVNTGKILTIFSNDYVKIQNNLTVKGTFDILNNGSLIQINDNGVNTGNISYNRNVTSLKGYDYIYWSSPVSSQSIDNLYITPSMGFKYYWNTLLPNSNGAGGNIGQGNWSVAGGNMVPGIGYIIRASSSFGWTGDLMATFTNKPNNGVIPTPIYRGNYNGVDYAGANGTTITSLSDNYNLIGNPYPSAISAESFLTTNTNINGSVNVWTHTNPDNSTVSPFYATFQYNYNNDYIVYNKVGSSGGANSFSGSINSGQGFFVSMVNGPADSTQSVVFNNSMRVINDNNFYRNPMVKSRIWIDILDSNNNPTRILVGYVNGATQNVDRMYDAITNPSNKIYSIIDNKPFVIQGRELPFKKNDEIKLGINITTSGVYKIAIAEVDGVFNTQNIYLEDKLLNITYELKSNPYTFTSNVGVFNDRFVLKYKTNNGNNDDKVSNNIKKVSVYDMMGIKVFEGDNESYKNMVPVRNHIYIVKTEMEDGFVITRKVSNL